MKIIATYIDPFGTGPLTDEDELALIKLRLSCFDEEFKFKTIGPHHFQKEKFDVCITDFGGLCSTDFSGTMRERVCQELAKAAEEKPSTLFIINSAMASRFFYDVVKEEHPELDIPNVKYSVVNPDDAWSDSVSITDTIKDWFGWEIDIDKQDKAEEAVSCYELGVYNRDFGEE